MTGGHTVVQAIMADYDARIHVFCFYEIAALQADKSVLF
jgi:hypothetical protein